LEAHGIGRGLANVVKKAIIEVVLVEESAQEKSQKIEAEIHDQLSRNLHLIPWAATLEKVTVKST
jgi:hypothetical protein